MNEIEHLLEDLIDDADHSVHEWEPRSRLGLDILGVLCNDSSIMPEPLSRVEEMWHDLYRKLHTSPDSDLVIPSSRIGKILTCILLDEEVDFEPLSRVEELMTELLQKYSGVVRTFEVFTEGENVLSINTSPNTDARVVDGVLSLRKHLAHVEGTTLVFEGGSE